MGAGAAQVGLAAGHLRAGRVDLGFAAGALRPKTFLVRYRLFQLLARCGFAATSASWRLRSSDVRCTSASVAASPLLAFASDEFAA